MKIKSQRDFFAGLFMMTVGAAFAIGATNYSFGVAAKPGPGYFPFGLGLILLLLGVLILVSALTSHVEGGDPVGAIPWRPLICVVGALVLFGYLMPRVGFVISFPLMIVVTAFGSTEFRWKEAVANALALTVFSYLVFIAGLKLNIPLWPA